MNPCCSLNGFHRQRTACSMPYLIALFWQLTKLPADKSCCSPYPDTIICWKFRAVLFAVSVLLFEQAGNCRYDIEHSLYRTPLLSSCLSIFVDTFFVYKRREYFEHSRTTQAKSIDILSFSGGVPQLHGPKQSFFSEVSKDSSKTITLLLLHG